ncbi:MAG: YihY/virulence factor BrkB family protein [Ilumatobacter sp.]|uniref:YihY/virulence factor BrkB family protein n=1 Tax=Ilumatobacter sp. TaxID=1967498 RepID=UPI00391C71EC
MPWTTSDKVMTIRERSHAFDVFAETMDGWRRHLSGRNASLLSFFAFLSVFPLMLAATTILGFVLADNDELRQRLIDGALSDIPGLSTDLAAGEIDGNYIALIVGVLGALWSSTKAFVGLQGALDDTWEIHVDDRAAMPKQRGKALVGILILGGAQLGSIVLATIVSAAGLPTLGAIGIIVGQVAINIVVMAAMYRYLTSATTTWASVFPGAVIAGSIFTLLQHTGTLIVRRITENAGDTYGQFALVLGIVTWLGLVAITMLMCAEFNAARERLAQGPTAQLGADFDLPIRL